MLVLHLHFGIPFGHIMPKSFRFRGMLSAAIWLRHVFQGWLHISMCNLPEPFLRTIFPKSYALLAPAIWLNAGYFIIVWLCVMSRIWGSCQSLGLRILNSHLQGWTLNHRVTFESPGDTTQQKNIKGGGFSRRICFALVCCSRIAFTFFYIFINNTSK